MNNNEIISKIIETLNKPNFETNSMLLLSNFTPSFFAGANTTLPMLMKKSHLRENIFNEKYAKENNFNIKGKHYHGLGLTTFLKVLKSLEYPQAVYRFTNIGNYKSNNYIALTNVQDKKGNNIIVPVEINQKGQYDNTEIACNRIKTVYGKENPNYFKRMIKEGFLFEIYNRNGRYSLSTNLKIYNTYISCFNNRFDADDNYVNAINILLQEGQSKTTCSFEIYKYNAEELSFIKKFEY